MDKWEYKKLPNTIYHGSQKHWYQYEKDGMKIIFSYDEGDDTKTNILVNDRPWNTLPLEDHLFDRVDFNLYGDKPSGLEKVADWIAKEVRKITGEQKMDRIEKIAKSMVAVAPFEITDVHTDYNGIKLRVRHTVIANNASVYVSNFTNAEKALNSYCADIVRNLGKVLPVNVSGNWGTGPAVVEQYKDTVSVFIYVVMAWQSGATLGQDFVSDVEKALDKLGYI